MRAVGRSTRERGARLAEQRGRGGGRRPSAPCACGRRSESSAPSGRSVTKSPRRRERAMLVVDGAHERELRVRVPRPDEAARRERLGACNRAARPCRQGCLRRGCRRHGLQRRLHDPVADRDPLLCEGPLARLDLAADQLGVPEVEDDVGELVDVGVAGRGGETHSKWCETARERVKDSGRQWEDSRQGVRGRRRLRPGLYGRQRVGRLPVLPVRLLDGRDLRRSTGRRGASTSSRNGLRLLIGSPPHTGSVSRPTVTCPLPGGRRRGDRARRRPDRAAAAAARP